MSYDLLVRNCLLVRPTGEVACSIAIKDGRVAAYLEPETAVIATRIIDAGSRHVIPGLIDTHVHFGNAGNSFEQDLRTESRAAATGGVTTMLVYVQALTEGSTYDQMLPACEAAVPTESIVDVMFHVGVVHPRFIPEIPRIADTYGVRSFKAFMTWKNSPNPAGTHGLTDGQLFEFFQNVAKVPRGVALVHCENIEIIEWAQRPMKASGRTDTAAWSESRPIFGELESIRRAIAFADEAGVKQFVLPHEGIGSGTEFLRQKQWGGLKVAVETCPHYLLFDKDRDMGVLGKVNPPLRERSQVEALWDRLVDGTCDLVGSDQLAFTREFKGTDIWSCRAGITGGMTMILPVLLSEGVHKGRLPLTKLVELAAVNPARIFGLYPRKGSLDLGADADLVILDEDREVRVTHSVLNTYSDFTAYEGYLSKGWARTTVVRGRVLYEDGELSDVSAGGEVVRPDPDAP